MFMQKLTIQKIMDAYMNVSLYLCGFARHFDPECGQETLVIRNVSNCVYLCAQPQNIVNYAKSYKLFDNFSENYSIFQIIVI